MNWVHVLDLPPSFQDGHPFLASGQVVSEVGENGSVDPFCGRVFFKAGRLHWVLNRMVVSPYEFEGDEVVIFEATRPDWMSNKLVSSFAKLECEHGGQL